MNQLKRALQNVDDDITSSSMVKDNLDQWNTAAALQRIQTLENYYDRRIVEEKRLNLPISCETKVNKCTLRLFFHHTFIPATETEASHFKFVCEGIVFREGEKHFHRNIGRHFQSFRILTDKKHILTPQQTFEWLERDFPRGVQATAIQCKLPAEKSGIIRISFHLNRDYAPKFKLSNELRNFFPSNIAELSEEEACTTILQYIASHQLFNEKDRRYFHCDESLKSLFGIELMSVHQIRIKLANHLFPPDAIEFEYYLNTAHTQDVLKNTVTNNRRCTSNQLMGKIGGRVFDFDVMELDETVFSKVQIMNTLAQDEYQCLQTTRQVHDRCFFIAREYLETEYLIHTIEAMLEEQKAKKPQWYEVPSDFTITPSTTTTTPTSSSTAMDVSEHKSNDDMDVSPTTIACKTEEKESVKTEEGITTTTTTTTQPPKKFLPSTQVVYNNHVKALRPLYPPNVFDLIGKRPLSEENAPAGMLAAATKRAKIFSDPMRTMDTSLHSLGGYLDVGNDSLFDSSLPWVQEICKAFIQEQQHRQQQQQHHNHQQQQQHHPAQTSSLAPGVVTTMQPGQQFPQQQAAPSLSLHQTQQGSYQPSASALTATPSVMSTAPSTAGASPAVGGMNGHK